jgi:hypothetical protein
MKSGSQEEMLKILKDAGCSSITSDTFIYEDSEGEMRVMEKPSRDSYPIDEGDTNGAYVGAFMWGSEWKLAEIEAAGGRGAASKHNINQANINLQSMK